MERVNAFVHYYRGELSKAVSWRDRLDRTTNWAIAAVAAALSVSLTRPEEHHGLLLFSMAIVFLLLVIESRRYRFFDIYRRRVRLIERGYYARVFCPLCSQAEQEWLRELSQSLRAPHFSISLMEAMAHRLRRNYCWMFLILLAAWLLKSLGTLELRDVIHQPSGIGARTALGWTSGWTVLGLVMVFYAWLIYVMIRYGPATAGEDVGEV